MQPSIIKSENVRLGEASPACAASGPAGTARGPASAGHEHDTEGARLIEVDGVVHAIEVRCGCGRVSVIELEYTDSPPAS